MKPTIFCLLILLTACQHSPKQQTKVFTKPVIVREPLSKSITAKATDRLSGVYPLFVGKFCFGDTITIPPVKPRRFSNDLNDFVYRDNIRWSQLDSLGADGLSVLPDYNTEVPIRDWDSIPHLYYFVYIVNESQENKMFSGRDGDISGIQEAQDSNQVWRPIEFKGVYFCGNGKWKTMLRPQQYVAVLFPKYKGSFKTKLRLRIQNGESVFVSKPFDGYINSEQFYAKQERLNLLQRLSNDPLEFSSSTFCGALPLEFSYPYRVDDLEKEYKTYRDTIFGF